VVAQWSASRKRSRTQRLLLMSQGEDASLTGVLNISRQAICKKQVTLTRFKFVCRSLRPLVSDLTAKDFFHDRQAFEIRLRTTCGMGVASHVLEGVRVGPHRKKETEKIGGALRRGALLTEYRV